MSLSASDPADDRQADVIITLVVSLAAAYIAVLLRFIARRIAGAGLRADDYMILIGLVFSTASAIDCVLGIHFGLGKHAIVASDPVSFAKNSIASEAIYSPAIASVKFSVIFLYRRIFPGRLKLSTIAIGSVVLVWTLVATIVAIFQCVPVQSMWDANIHGRCINTSAFLTVMGCLNVLTDALLLALPVPILWKLQMSLMHKMQLMAIFLTGGLVCVVSICRVYYLAQVSVTDATWTDTNGVIWTVAETGVAVVSACLPTLRPLFKHRALTSLVNSAKYVESNSERRGGVSATEAQHGDMIPLKLFNTGQYSTQSHNRVKSARANVQEGLHASGMGMA